MALPTFTMRQLLEAGVHFGHVTRRWNPKMAPYIFGVRRGVHIIDLQQTVPMLYRAMKSVQEIVAGGGRVLWVGTKRQASEPITEAAKRCGQYYINHRWLGGTLTNWQTISKSIKRLRALDAQMEEENIGLTKKELLRLNRERDKLERALGGIKEMGGLPDVLFIIDTNKESIAVAEAKKLGIPVVGVVDSNSDPSGIDFPIPGNDDSTRAINLYCDLLSSVVLSGIQEEITASGGDLGEQEDGMVEDLPAAKDADADAAPAATDAAAKDVDADAVPAATDGAAKDVDADVDAAPATTDGAAKDADVDAAPAAATATESAAEDVEPRAEAPKAAETEPAPAGDTQSDGAESVESGDGDAEQPAAS